MIFPKYLLAVSVAALLSGCDMAPHYVRPAMPVPPALPGVSAAVEPADIAWRDFVTDDRLRRLIALALDQNRDLRVAVANVAQARAQYHVQRAELAPRLGGSADATFQKLPAGTSAANTGSVAGAGRSDVYSVEAGIAAWEIDLFGRLRDLSRAAQERYLASQDARDAVQVSLIAELASAYLTMAADQDRLRIARDTQAAFGQTLDLNKARFRTGISSDLEVRQAQTSFDQARSDVAELTTLVAQDRNRIDLLAGASVPVDLLPESLPADGSILAQLPQDLVSTVLLRRPDIAGAERELRAANADIGAARAAFFPQISLTAMAGTLSLGLSNLFGGGSGTWTVAPSATLPIFDFGRTKGNLRYAEASRDAALARYERSIQSGFREVADALARRRTIDAQLEAQRSLREAATVAYRLSDARFRKGVAPFLDTLDAQRTAYAAEKSLVATR
ncbi:MAG: NodT family efflux system outer rane lipoprotein, partial [Rhizorhabdus sp.]|nr:NodT family efflux system outer rane lipoprotein [Rhizorhabdus sp.]